MIKRLSKIVTILCLLLISNRLFADDKAVIEKITAHVQKLLPTLTIDQVKESPIKGLYAVTIGPRIIFFSEDARYMLQGEIIDTITMTNLTAAEAARAIAKAVENIGEENMIIYPATSPKGTPTDTVTVFTDIDCGYCRKLHKDINKYNKAGITIRYLFMPRAGKNSKSYDKAVSVWCAKDQKSAMTKAKKGQRIETKQCENPIDKHLILAKMLGINGTPALVLGNGELIPGYVPAEKLKIVLANERTKMNKQQVNQKE